MLTGVGEQLKWSRFYDVSSEQVDTMAQELDWDSSAARQHLRNMERFFDLKGLRTDRRIFPPERGNGILCSSRMETKAAPGHHGWYR